MHSKYVYYEKKKKTLLLLDRVYKDFAWLVIPLPLMQ